MIAASSGSDFLDAPAIAALRELLSSGVVVTPNLPEAALLAEVPPERLVDSLDARLDAARRLLAAGARAVLIKGGHGNENPVRDLVLEPPAPPLWIERPRHPGPGLRGSGCRFATATAACLARGDTLATAAERAGTFVAGRIDAARG